MEEAPFNLRFYKKHLSPFGQKVLQVLLSERTGEKNNNTTSDQKWVNINQNSCCRNTTPCDTQINYYGHKKCYLKFREKEIPICSTPNDLHNISSTEKSDPDIACRDDLVTPAIEIHSEASDSMKINQGNEVNQTGCIDTKKYFMQMDKIDCVSAINFDSGCTSEKDDISWNDMFDTELFQDDKLSDSDLMITDEINKVRTNETTPASFCNPKETLPKMDDESKKHKSSIKKIEHPIKKEKKFEPISKNNYKKEKYTKTVKNWLNNVEETLANVNKIDELKPNPDKEKKDSNTEYDSSNKRKKSSKKGQMKKESTPATKGNNSASPIVIEETKKPVKKKVVQAQLANKDGIMKFKKPKITLESDADVENSIALAVSTAAKSDKEVVKEKRPKSKFVAPIKSQIPVKDITYNITKINESNIDDSEVSITRLENAEICIVLVYSNGFCQLNGCYTEDTCVPEGLLVSVAGDMDDDYYYFTNINEKFRTMFAHILERNTVVCYEGKSILIFLSDFNINFKPLSILDAKIGGALLDPDNPPESFSALQKLVGFAAQFTVATACSLQKAAWYSTLLRDCFAKLRAALVEQSMWNVFVDLEMRLLPIIADMEKLGVSVDVGKLSSMQQQLEARLQAAERASHAAAGRAFPLGSAPQLRALLYDHLKLDERCRLRVRGTTVQGAKSTSEATLRSLMAEHPLPGLVLQYRHLHKAHATFLSGIAQHVTNGTVKPTWVQMAAATGRIASNNPNLQAIPKAPFSLDMFPQPGDDAAPALNFRSVYVARAGHRLLAADFRHVECRVVALAARDRALQAALASDDLFRVLAAQWLNKSPEEISPSDRERTKRVVYGSLYGCGARALADVLAVPYDHALAVLTSFHRTFPSLKEFGRDVVARCQAAGRLRTLSGRARRFPNIGSTDAAARAHAERQAVNYIVQGSAADLCKMAMVLTTERLRAHEPPLRARLVLQIHDELVWEVHEDDVLQAAGVVRAGMEASGAACGCAGLRLPVALASGRSWGELTPLQLDAAQTTEHSTKT